MDFDRSVHLTTAPEWRAWLAANHATEDEIWLVYSKQHTGKPRVSYEDAVREALCVGWIDGRVRRIDADRYMQRFTPRRAGSNWSACNVSRVRELMAQGAITAAGLATIPPELLVAEDPPRPALDDPPRQLEKDPPRPAAEATPPAGPVEVVLSPELEAALRANHMAWENFQGLAPSYRKLYVRWIMDAKRPETRRRRLEESMGRLEANEKLGMK